MTKQKGHSERAHALLSASGASRWLSCPPSARLEDEIPDKGSSEFAKEGTTAHELAELRLIEAISGGVQSKSLKERFANIKKDKFYSDEMEEYVGQYVNYVLECVSVAHQNTVNPKLLIEDRIDLTEFIPEGFGTGDSVLIADEVMEVIDLKYGKGIKVFASNNPQLKLYGLGALLKHELAFDIKIVRLTVAQPRLDHIDSWDIDVEDLKKWGENVVKPTAALAFNGHGEFSTGDHCRWCKHAPRCKHLAQDVSDVVEDFAEPTTLTDDELMTIHSKLPLIEAWANAIKTYILTAALNGKKWEGLKLVAGRSVRSWKDKDLVMELLKKDGYNQSDYCEIKLLGIGKIEKLVGKAEFPKLLGDAVIKPEGKPTLVDESDKRPEIILDIANDFKD